METRSKRQRVLATVDAAQEGLLNRIQREDANGNLLSLVLELCAPPMMPTPAVLRRCAASARFLRELVQQVRSRHRKRF